MRLTTNPGIRAETIIIILVLFILAFITGTIFLIKMSSVLEAAQEATPLTAVANDAVEASAVIHNPHKMNVSIKNVKSEKITGIIDLGDCSIPTFWYAGYNVSADAFNAGSDGLLTVSCDAFNKKNGALVAHTGLSFISERNVLTPFVCQFEKDNLPKGDYVFDVTVAEEIAKS